MAAILNIEFHNTRPEEGIEFRIRRELAEIEKFYDRLLSCNVDVRAPEHKHRGSVFKVHIDLGFPPDDAALWATLDGAEFRNGADHMEVNAQHKDPAMAVHAAFNAARRRLKDLVNVR